MRPDLAPRRTEMLRQHDEIAVEVTIACPGDIARRVLPATRARCRIADARDQRRQPLQPELSLAQQLHTTREVSVLVEYDSVPLARIRASLPVEDRTDIAHLDPPPERHREAVLERVIAPTAARKRMLVQVVVRDHERRLRLHLSRRHLQQPRAAVRELRPRGTCAKTDEQHGRHDGRCPSMISSHVLVFQKMESDCVGIALRERCPEMQLNLKAAASNLFLLSRPG